ncbi:MAG: hypothetical protein IJZ89_00330 [Clostridia bacterium]|nr:hypothetical protein [Clostridia bacterium]
MKKTNLNLIPDTINLSPDYYCTWQTQLYATSNGRPPKQRWIIGEKAMFSEEKPFGWAYFHEKARGDLLFIMDDSWDVPLDGNTDYYGSLILNEEKYPTYTEGKTNAEALKMLTEKMKSLGWKGLGGWVCAQESEFCKVSPEEYWKERMREADESGFAYWKVDWGKKDGDAEFRKMLTDLAREYAPDLIIEQSFTKDVIPYADVFRTYDVPAIMSIPMTMEKLANYTDVPAPVGKNKGLIDCEDEAYIAAAGGFAMGIMRHPYVGDLPNGSADPSFPAIHRNLKTKMYEVIRAARFHRIAPAFAAVGENTRVSPEKLSDTWQFVNIEDEIEGWWLVSMSSIKNFIDENKLLTKTAPAVIARNTSLPEIKPSKDGHVPYCMASKNPNGVFGIVTLGRTIGRDYFIPKCEVSADIGDSKIIGVFGEYESLILKTAHEKIGRVLMQDLADETAYDITELVKTEGGRMIIPGSVISEIGRSAQPEDDTSEPGVIIKID